MNINKLMCYAFESKEDYWIYGTTIMNGAFTLYISVLENGNVGTNLVENETNEPYVLYKTNAFGTFVRDVRTEVEKVLKKIADECFEFSMFKSEQALKIIDYIRDTYGDELEFLWAKFPTMQYGEEKTAINGMVQC